MKAMIMAMKFKKVVAFVLSVLLCLSPSFPACAFGAEDFPSGDDLLVELEPIDGATGGQNSEVPEDSKQEPNALGSVDADDAISALNYSDRLSESVSPVVDFVYIDASVLTVGGTQLAAVGFSGCEIPPSSATLYYNVDGVKKEVRASTITVDAALFEIAIGQDAEWAKVVLEGILLEGGHPDVEGTYLLFEKSDALGFNVVSEELANGAEEEQAASEPGVIALGVDGNLSKSDTLESALEEAGAAQASSISQYLRLSNRSSSTTVVAIDPGHGGSDPGAVNDDQGLRESELTWKIAEYCRQWLQKNSGVQVFMTRAQGEYVTIRDRVDRSIAAGADLIVSIHINSGGGTGAEVWIPRSGGFNGSVHEDASKLADEVLLRLSELGLTDRGKRVRGYFESGNPDYSDSEGYYEDGTVADYYGIIRYARKANIPAVIVEHAFIDHSQDVQKLKSESFLRQAGEADAAAIASYFNSNKIVSLVLSKDEISIGQSLEMSVAASCDLSGYSFNYVWAYEGKWKEWDSTVKREGSMTSDTSWTFAPLKRGKYVLYLDVQSPDGVTTTLEREIWVDEDWSGATISAPDTVELGSSVTCSAELSDGGDVAYNYVWRYDSGWEEWSSTVKTSGSTTLDRSFSFKPTKAGAYDLYIDVVDGRGISKTLGPKRVAVEETFDCVGVDAPSSILVGESVVFSPCLSGNSSGLSYNYVWSYEGGWDSWSSTLKETGSYSREKSFSFKPDRKGTYHLYIDVRDSRGRVETFGSTVVVKSDYEVSGIKCPKEISLGETLCYSPCVEGNSTGFRYNYVWRYEGSWDTWDSTVKRTGVDTAETSFSFTPTKSGHYDLFIDVVDSKGTKTTMSASVQVATAWSFTSIDAPSAVAAGQEVVITPKVEPAGQELRYNYVWCYEETWDDWSSTVRETGTTTNEAQGTFVPRRSGRYVVYVDVSDSFGNVKTLSTSVQVRGNSIMGTSLVDVSQMGSYYRSKGKTYPELYASKGAATIDDYCRIVQEEADAEGVRSDILFAQAMKETGWLQFSGSVKVDQCNFGGLGAISATAQGAVFPDVRTGVRAQAQHLKAYASIDSLNNVCVDPRFHLVERGIAPCVEDLNGRWAVPGTDYGQGIMTIVREMAAF